MGQTCLTWIDAGRPAVLVGWSAVCDLRVPTGAKHHVLVIKG